MKWLIKKHYNINETQDLEGNNVRTRGDFSHFESVMYTDEPAIPRGGNLEYEYMIVSGDDSDNPNVVTDENGNVSVTSSIGKEKEMLINAKYKEMYDLVIDGMYSTFGTHKTETATANAATWEAMVKRPNNYIDEDLGFNTVDDVVNYAESKLLAADGYGIYRIKLMENFRLERLNIINS